VQNIAQIQVFSLFSMFFLIELYHWARNPADSFSILQGLRATRNLGMRVLYHNLHCKIYSKRKIQLSISHISHGSNLFAEVLEWLFVGCLIYTCTFSLLKQCTLVYRQKADMARRQLIVDDSTVLIHKRLNGCGLTEVWPV